jgi:hypothetical protein
MFWVSSYLEFNLGLSNIGLAAASVGDLLGLGDLVLDSLSQCQLLHVPFQYISPTSELKSSRG